MLTNITWTWCDRKPEVVKEGKEKEKSYFMNKAWQPNWYSCIDRTVEEIAIKMANGYGIKCFQYHPLATRYLKKNAIESEVLMLDFDNTDISPFEMVEYAETLGLKPNFIYWTFSQNPQVLETLEIPDDYRFIKNSPNPYDQNKEVIEIFEKKPYKTGYNYRAAWCYDGTIDAKTYTQVYINLIETFKEYGVDKSTKDESRIFWGSNIGSIIINEEPTELSSLGWLEVIKRSEEGMSNQRVHSGTKGCQIDWEAVEIPDMITVDEDWMKKLRPFCTLLDKWMNGEYIQYNQRLTLWSNLRYLKYSSHDKSIYKDIMKYYDAKVYLEHTFTEEELKSKMRDKSLKPNKIVSWGGKSITVPQFFENYNELPLVPDVEKITPEEAQQWMKDNFVNTVENNKMLYFNGQTGLGKTESVINYYINLWNGYRLGKRIYACPNHDNCEEFEGRLRDAWEDAFAKRKADIPIYRIMPNDEETEEDDIRMKLGLPRKTKDKERNEILKLLHDEHTEGVFIITHSMLTNIGANIRSAGVIVDENIENSFISNIKIPITELYNLGQFLDDELEHRWSDMCRKLKQEELFTVIAKKKDWENNVRKVDEWEFPSDYGEILMEGIDYLEKNIDEIITQFTKDNAPTGLFRLKECDFIKVSYTGDRKKKERKDWNICVRGLYKSKILDIYKDNGIPIAFLTATPMNHRLKDYYKDVDINIVSVPEAKNIGKVIQYCGVTGAKGWNGEKLKKHINYVNLRTDVNIGGNAFKNFKKNSWTISFKGTKDFWESNGYKVAAANDNQTHFLNCAGLDYLKGQWVNVYGKADLPLDFYEDLWSDIGDGSELQSRNWITIFRNGVEQTLYLFQEEAIRNEQLQYLDYAGTQAIGRARALFEEDAFVIVFSDYVYPNVDEVYDLRNRKEDNNE